MSQVSNTTPNPNMKQFCKRATRCVLISSLTLCTLASVSGCYKKVISTRGITADAHHPVQGKSSKTKIDKAIDNILGIENK